MALQDYTTEELKAELKRRQIEARKARSRKGVKLEYGYAIAKVTWVSKDPFCKKRFRIKILDDWAAKYHSEYSDTPIDRKVFNKSNHPQVGDIVKVKSRKTKYAPNGFGLFSNVKIVEIIKCNTEE